MSTVPTLLVCDIQPGALVQRYSVQWFRQFPGVTQMKIYKGEGFSTRDPNFSVHLDSITCIGEERFELTLNAMSSLNGSQHLCVVTVNHDRTLNETYPGGIVTLRTTGMKLQVTEIIFSSIHLCYCQKK